MAFKLLDEDQAKEIPDFAKGSEHPLFKDRSDIDVATGKPVLEQRMNQGLVPETLRLATQAATEIGSTVAGLPGNIFNFVNELAARPLSEAITGKESIPYEKTPIGRLFPKTQTINESIEKLVPFTKPRNEYEQFGRDVIGTATNLFLPGGQAKVGAIARISPPFRAFAKALGAHLFGEAIKDVTGDQVKGSYGTMGSLFLLSLLDRQGSSQHIAKLYSNAKTALKNAGNPTVNASKYISRLQELRSSLTKGTLAPSEQAVVNEIDAILGKVKNGHIAVEELQGISRSLSEIKESVVNSAAGKVGRHRAKRFFGSLSKFTNDELNAYSNKNPSFGVPYKSAQEAFAVKEQSNLIARAFEGLTGYIPKNPALAHMFGGAAISQGATSLSSGGTALPAIGAYQVGKLIYRVFKSPTLRKIYLNALKDASKGSIAPFAKNVKKMDAILDKEDEKKPSYRLAPES